MAAGTSRSDHHHTVAIKLPRPERSALLGAERFRKVGHHPGGPPCPFSWHLATP